MAKVNEINLSSLKKTLNEMDSDKAKLGLSLLSEIEFMSNTLSALKKDVNDNGVVTEMCQGAYNIQRANPSLQAYNVTIKNYNSLIKQLADLLPKEEYVSEDTFDDDNL